MSEHESTGPEQDTPFHVLMAELDTADEQLAATHQKSAELEEELAETRRSIARVGNDREAAFTRFVEQLAEAPELYRSVFELMIADWGDKPLSDEDHAGWRIKNLAFANNKAQELTALDDFVRALEQPAPVLLAKTPTKKLVANPQCLSHPSESDLERQNITGIDATLAMVEPNQQLTIQDFSYYKLGQGRTTTARAITLPTTKATHIETQLTGFDHDVLLAEPDATTADKSEVELLSFHVGQGLGLNLTPSIFLESGESEPPQPPRLSLYVGATCVAEVIEKLQLDAQENPYDNSALRLLAQSWHADYSAV